MEDQPLYIGELDDLADAATLGREPRVTLADSRGNVADDRGAVRVGAHRTTRRGRAVNAWPRITASPDREHDQREVPRDGRAGNRQGDADRRGCRREADLVVARLVPYGARNRDRAPPPSRRRASPRPAAAPGTAGCRPSPFPSAHRTRSSGPAGRSAAAPARPRAASASPTRGCSRIARRVDVDARRRRHVEVQRHRPAGHEDAGIGRHRDREPCGCAQIRVGPKRGSVRSPPSPRTTDRQGQERARAKESSWRRMACSLRQAPLSAEPPPAADRSPPGAPRASRSSNIPAWIQRTRPSRSSRRGRRACRRRQPAAVFQSPVPP